MTDDKLIINKLQTGFSTNDIACSLFLRCSGCRLQKNVRLPPVWQELSNFFITHDVEADLISREIIEYRSKIKLAVRGTSSDPQIGLFMEGSHKVVDLPFCPLHYPVMNEALSLIRNKIVEYKIEPYHEESSKGCLRYIQMVVNRKTNKLQLSLIFNTSVLEENEREFIRNLYQSGEFWHSIWANFLEGSTNTILGKKWELIQGEEWFWQDILGIKFYFHPSCFSQAHLSVFEEMLKYIDSLIVEGGNVLELYAGVGCIGLYIAQKSKKVILAESSPLAHQCFKKTVLESFSGGFDKCTFHSCLVEELKFPEESIDVLIVDPPRKGLSKKCKEKISQLHPKQLIYVSCGPHSFLRDAKELLDEGWVLNKARGFLLFPGTDHAEIVASFIKSPSSKESPIG